MAIESNFTQLAEAAVQAIPTTAPEHDVRTLFPRKGLLEYWYPAIEDRKVKNKPVGLMITGVQLVLFRGKDGNVAALWNVCPHRGGSLMHGDSHFKGTVSCPYHGWTFDSQGNVLVVLPEGPESKIPGKVKARNYPTQTLRGMVWIWMGEGEPAPVEEDVPPEFFHDKGMMLYAWEVWPLNWAVAVENAGDAHVPYVHRNAALVMMSPMGLLGPKGIRTNVINDRTATFGIRLAPPKNEPSENGAEKKAPIRPMITYSSFFPAVNSEWPKRRGRYMWNWISRWAGKRRYTKNKPIDTSDEWSGMLHHLPAIVRLDYLTHVYSRINVPIDGDNTRQIYVHYAKAPNLLAKIYEKLNFHMWHRWAMYSNFSVQDFKAAGPQRYDTREYLSATDAHLAVWRRLLLKARGMQGAAQAAETPAEEFSRDRQIEVGMTPEWGPDSERNGDGKS